MIGERSSTQSELVLVVVLSAITIYQLTGTAGTKAAVRIKIPYNLSKYIFATKNVKKLVRAHWVPQLVR